jgi:hypothetical protein
MQPVPVPLTALKVVELPYFKVPLWVLSTWYGPTTSEWWWLRRMVRMVRIITLLTALSCHTRYASVSSYPAAASKYCWPSWTSGPDASKIDSTFSLNTAQGRPIRAAVANGGGGASPGTTAGIKTG